jgi:hypothetical protein
VLALGILFVIPALVALVPGSDDRDGEDLQKDLRAKFADYKLPE